MTVRLRHPRLHDVNFNVVHYRRYTEPLPCLLCNEIHEYKTYHLHLDSSGEVEVSDEIYERLAELKGLPLKKAGKVAKPKPQVLSMPAPGTPVRLVRPAIELFIPKDLRERNGGP